MAAKVSGTLSTAHSEGTIQFDPTAGLVIASKQTLGMSGQLSLNARDANFVMENTDEQVDTAELREKLPD